MPVKELAQGSSEGPDSGVVDAGETLVAAIAMGADLRITIVPTDLSGSGEVGVTVLNAKSLVDE